MKKKTVERYKYIQKYLYNLLITILRKELIGHERIIKII